MDTRLPHLRPALAASLLLHAALLAFFAWKAADTVGPARQLPQYITIEFAARPLRPRSRQQQEAPPASVAATDETSATTTSAESPSPAATTPVAATPVATASDAPGAAAPSITASTTKTADSPTGTLPPDASPAAPNTLDTVRLQQSIAGLATGLRSTNTQRWMQDCRPARNKELPDDCPTRRDNRGATRTEADTVVDAMFDSWIRGHGRNDRISRQLIADMNALRPLMEQEGLLAEIASERYYFMREQYRYLNGDDPIPGGSRDSIIRYVQLDLGGITLLGGLMRIEFDGDVKWGRDQTQGPALPFDVEQEPCDYAEGCD